MYDIDENNINEQTKIWIRELHFHNKQFFKDIRKIRSSKTLPKEQKQILNSLPYGQCVKTLGRNILGMNRYHGTNFINFFTIEIFDKIAPFTTIEEFKKIDHKKIIDDLYNSTDQYKFKKISFYADFVDFLTNDLLECLKVNAPDNKLNDWSDVVFYPEIIHKGV